VVSTASRSSPVELQLSSIKLVNMVVWWRLSARPANGMSVPSAGQFRNQGLL